MQQLTLFDLPEGPPSPRRLTQSQQLDLLVIGLQARVVAMTIAPQLEPCRYDLAAMAQKRALKAECQGQLVLPL